jgi:molecular chaperone GrpE
VSGRSESEIKKAPPLSGAALDEADVVEPSSSATVFAQKEGRAKSATADDGVDGPASDDADPEDENHEAAVQGDLDELVATAAQRDEYLALAQRTQADFENYRKRMAREVGAAEARGVVRLVKELLPALDNLERALDSAGDGEGSLADGVRLVQSELLAALKRVGVEAYSPAGEAFDPQCHEAMAQQPVEGAEPGTVVEVYQAGYRLGDAVIRPARVVVAA